MADKDANMKRGLMMSAFMGDCTDPELYDKVDAIGWAGISFISSPLCICRPKFARYPFYCTYPHSNGLSGAIYDLMQYDSLFWESFEDKIKLLNSAGIGLQVDVMSAVTFRHDEFGPYTHNIQGIVPSMSLATDRPTGLWATVLDNLGKKIVPYLNQLRMRGVLWSLEGGNAHELWLKNRLLYHGIKPDTLWITNSGTKGMINCPHLHSVPAFKNYKVKGGYVSNDGWTLSASQMRQIVSFGKQYGWAAIEYYSPYLSADREGDYSVRGRPSLSLIKTKCGNSIKVLCS